VRGFGPLEFQLMLLRRMADYQPALVEEAVAALGQPRSAVRDANRRWQAMLHSRTFPGGLTRLRLILGPPVTEFEQQFGDLTQVVARWRLPLWPDLRFEAIALPDGPVLQEWLVRPDPGTRPQLATPADVLPWSCVVGDLEAAFSCSHEEGDAPSRWTVKFTIQNEAREARLYVARFTWGLVQVVEEPGGG
jgi:hypothetical protein